MKKVKKDLFTELEKSKENYIRSNIQYSRNYSNNLIEKANAEKIASAYSFFTENPDVKTLLMLEFDLLSKYNYWYQQKRLIENYICKREYVDFNKREKIFTCMNEFTFLLASIVVIDWFGK